MLDELEHRALELGEERRQLAEAGGLDRIAAGGNVLVGEPPNLWLMTDSNGDLKADTKEAVNKAFGRAEGNRTFDVLAATRITLGFSLSGM